MYLTSAELRTVLPDPKQIVTALDQYVIGQIDLKKTLALMMLRRGLIGLQKARRLPSTPVFDKSNVLIIGPSGTGKTSSIKALQKIFDIPLSIVDVTELTASGYVGKDIISVVEKYVENCEKWVNERTHLLLPIDEIHNEAMTEIITSPSDRFKEIVENGIIYLDEIDKIRKKDTGGNDVGGGQVQNELLQILENGVMDLGTGYKSTFKTAYRMYSLDMTNVTLLCGGAFDGLDEIIEQRLKKKNSIGFNSEIVTINKDNYSKSVTTEDLINYGFKPEFLGRIPLRTTLNSLSACDLERIITEPKDNLYNQYKLVFKTFGVDLTIEKDAIRYMSEQALKLKIGARSLKQVFTSLLTDALFELHSYTDKTFNINLQYVKDRV